MPQGERLTKLANKDIIGSHFQNVIILLGHSAKANVCTNTLH